MDHLVLNQAIATLLAELIDGAPAGECYVLNRRDPGLLRSLDRLSADQASAPAADGGASVAAHVDHLWFGFDLMNRWIAGENAFENADFAGSWNRGRVTEDEWKSLRGHLAAELEKWRDTLRHLDSDQQIHVTGAIASIVHMAYHVGAIRQINRSLAGPRAESN